MTRDTLDDLLDRSAPETRETDAAGVRAMIAQARAAARTGRGRRRSATILTAGALSLLLVGSAGVAMARSGWPWEAGYQDPAPSGSATSSETALFVYPYTNPTGQACELRVDGRLRGSGGITDTPQESIDALRAAVADGELKRRVDEGIPDAYARQRESDARGEATPPSPTPAQDTSDSDYFMAASGAVFQAMSDVLNERGLPVPDFSHGADGSRAGSWSTSGNCTGGER